MRAARPGPALGLELLTFTFRVGREASVNTALTQDPSFSGAAPGSEPDQRCGAVGSERSHLWASIRRVGHLADLTVEVTVTDDRCTVGVDFGTLSGRAVVVRASDGTELGTAVHEYAHAVMD